MKRALPFVLLLLIAMAACGDGLPPEFPAPKFSLKSPLDSSVIDNTAISNRPAIVYWFTSW